jgi:putative MATE family efflux protein
MSNLSTSCLLLLTLSISKVSGFSVPKPIHGRVVASLPPTPLSGGMHARTTSTSRTSIKAATADFNEGNFTDTADHLLGEACSSDDVDEAEIVRALIEGNPPPFVGRNNRIVDSTDIVTGTEPSNREPPVDSEEYKRSMSTPLMIREIAALGIPALGGMLIDPLMSLVDTACVGQVSSMQLASLAPCTSIYQFFFQVFFFLSTTTTTLVAANPLDKDFERGNDLNEKVVSCATMLALALGTVGMVSLFAWSDPLMKLAGCANAEMLMHGRKYLRIRALGLPLVLVATVLQGASLGRQDAWTPLKIFLTAGLLNVIGDVWLTLHLNWGVTGAAVATLASQVTAAGYYCYKSMNPSPNNKKGTVRLTYKGLPDKELLRKFSSMAFSLLLKAITTMGAYSLLTKSASTMGAMSLAAHQVTLQVWWLLSYIPEPASTAAQSLVARDMKERPWRVPKLVKVLYGSSLITGAVIAAVTGIVLTVPRLSGMIVADPVVKSLLLATAAPAMLAQVVCSVGSLSDGLAIGSGDYKYLPLNSSLALVNLVIALHMVSRRGLGVAGVWMASSVFFISRLVGHLALSKKLRVLLCGSSRRQGQLQTIAQLSA